MTPPNYNQMAEEWLYHSALGNNQNDVQKLASLLAEVDREATERAINIVNTTKVSFTVPPRTLDIVGICREQIASAIRHQKG